MKRQLKQQVWNFKSLTAVPVTVMGMAWSVAAPTAARASTKPTPLRVGQTVQVTLDKDGSFDYSVPLGRGTYRIVWDARRTDGEASNIIGNISLLKPNGSIIDASLLHFNVIGVTGRVGKTYRSLKPFVARLRLKNDNAATDNWLTIVPVSQTKRVPFGWGATITPARISSDNGVGGPLEAKQSVFHSITLPRGKWSISLGLSLPQGQSSNLIGSVDLLDAQGFTTQSSLVRLNEVNNQGRKEAILNISKPTPILLRVNNDHNVAYEYDLTIEKAS